MGITGARSESGNYYRFLKDIDVTDAEKQQKFRGIIDIMHKQCCRVVVDPAPEPDSPVAGFLAELRKIECLHFADP